MISRLLCTVAALITVLVLAACATRATTIDAQWVNPAIVGKRSVPSVMVIAALRDATHRRMLEDRMAESLAAAGVKAVQSYKLLPDSGQVTEEQLRRAVAASSTSHVMASSISSVSTDVRVTQGMMMGPAWGPGRGWTMGMGPSWGGMTGYYNSMWARSVSTEVRTTQNLHGDTRLFDSASSEVVWSAATTTATGWDSVPQMIDQFVRLMVETLKKDAVI